jgi:hypothetical protein
MLPATQCYVAPGYILNGRSLLNLSPGKAEIEQRKSSENLRAVCLMRRALHSQFLLSKSDTLAYSFIHLAICLTAGQKPLPKRAVHIVRSRASSFRCEYPLLSLRSSSSFLRALPRFPVTSIPPFIFPSITCCRRQVLCKM